MSPNAPYVLSVWSTGSTAVDDVLYTCVIYIHIHIYIYIYIFVFSVPPSPPSLYTSCSSSGRVRYIFYLPPALYTSCSSSRYFPHPLSVWLLQNHTLCINVQRLPEYEFLAIGGAETLFKKREGVQTKTQRELHNSQMVVARLFAP